jgi:glycosyltransferase involved in cell wall biosynthesis
VVNSRLGYEAVRRHGRALASVSDIWIPFFSESPFALGAPYSARFLFDVIAHARVFADNERVLQQLSGRLGHQFGDRFLLLPQAVEFPPRGEFEEALADRVARRPSSAPRVLWLSRWCPFKAPGILVELARRWPELRVDVYGVPDTVADFPAVPGLRRHGVVNPAAVPVELYDAYIFTSLFEGMPTVVLEMAARGIPCVCSDVGGLREVFDEGCVDFIPAGEDPRQAGAQFEAALREATRRRGAELAARLRAARRAVEARSSRADFVARLTSMLDLPAREHAGVSA